MPACSPSSGAEEPGDPYLAAPSIVDWDHIDGFRYHREPRDEPSHADLDYYQAVSALGEAEAIDIDDLKRPSIRVVGSDGQETARWSIYKCLIFELELGAKRYILSEGNWFEVDGDFAAEINERVGAIDLATFALPESLHNEKEELYNARVGTPPLVVLDRRLLPVGRGRYRDIELCDLLDSDPQATHPRETEDPLVDAKSPALAGPDFGRVTEGRS